MLLVNRDFRLFSKSFVRISILRLEKVIRFLDFGGGEVYYFKGLDEVSSFLEGLV